MPFSLLQPLHDIPLAVVDTETTGISPAWGDRVIELGILRIEGGQIVSRYQQLIDPQRRVSPGITALTGISQAMVAGQPRFADQLPRALECLSGAVLVAHNAPFDLSFLQSEFRHAGLDIAQNLGQPMHVLDTVRIARRRYGRGGNGLQNLARRLGVAPVSAHRALADALTTLGVLEKMLEPLAGWKTTLADALIAQGGPMRLDDGQANRLPLELEEALESGSPVRMEYLDANERRTQRVVVPQFIRHLNGEVVLAAHCQLRGAQRYFKLERIVRLSRIVEELP